MKSVKVSPGDDGDGDDDSDDDDDVGYFRAVCTALAGLHSAPLQLAGCGYYLA